MNTYETLFILHPDLEESEINKTIDTVQEIITSGGGTVLKAERWGKRQLAYMIRKKREGYYVLIYFEALPTFIDELNRRYKLTDMIMRYLVIQLRKDQIKEILEDSSAKMISTQEPLDSNINGEDEGDIGFDADEELVASTEGS